MRKAVLTFALISLCLIIHSNTVHANKPLSVALPSYDGVDQLLLLNKRWVVVATSDREELIEQIDILSNGKFKPAVQAWRKMAHLDRWQEKKPVQKLAEKYWIEAREKSGERVLNDPYFYTITSTDDTAYEVPQHPVLVEKYLAIQGKEKIPGFVADYSHYSYLEFPTPMQHGKTYTISLENGKSVTFLYDELHSVSRLIKVNQIGYLPQVKNKYAFLSGYIPGIGPVPGLEDVHSFEVIDAFSGETVHVDRIHLREKNPRYHNSDGLLMSGEDIYELDITPLRTEGWYFIRVPGVGRSWPFRVARDVYGKAFYTAARALYHQRSGMALEPQYTAWTRAASQTEPVYESEHLPFTANVKAPKGYKVFDVIGGTIDFSKSTEDGTGGWHDAGDWDRRMDHYVAVFDMLNAYEWHPKKFTSGQLNLPQPETFKVDTPIPDLLLEIEYGLRAWKKSMNVNGGVAGAIETWSHPSFNDPNYKWAYSQRTRWASLAYAAAAAQYARLVAPFAREHAQDYANSAVKAYNFGISPTNAIASKDGGPAIIHAKTKRGQGDPYTIEWREEFSHIAPYLIAAKIQLYLVSHHKRFLGPVPGHPDYDLAGLLKSELAKKRLPFKRPHYNEQDVSPWLYFGIFNPEIRGYLSENLVRLLEVQYLQHADTLSALSDKDPYRRSHTRTRHDKMSWGYGTLTNRARVLLIAHHLTGDDKFFAAALHNIDYVLGANPNGMSWTTGLGYVYPIEIHHGPSRTDGIDDPVPGITVYGPNGRKPWQFNHIWNPKNSSGETVAFVDPKKLEIPLLRNWHTHPHYNVAQNEFTIHETIAASVFCYALLTPDGWEPNEKLLSQKPRPMKMLFGQWYLP